MNTTRRGAHAATYKYNSENPGGISSAERAKLTEQLTVFGKREPCRKKLFAARFHVMGGAHYVVFTERLTDLCSISASNDGTWTLECELGEPRPEGTRLISPKPIRAADWDALATQACYRDTFSAPRKEHGRELEETREGARFDGGSTLGDIFVVTNSFAVGVDLFVRPRGKRVRHVLNLMSE